MLPLAFGLGGAWDIPIIAAVIILLFGTSKLAGLGKSAGESIREFKKATRDEEEPVTTTRPVVTTNSEEK